MYIHNNTSVKERMRKFTKIVTIILSAVLILSLFPSQIQAKAASTPKLSKKNITIVEGKSKSVSVKANGIKIQSISWKSSDNSIVKATKSGKLGVKIKGLTYGNATVTANVKTKDKTYSLSVNVSVEEDINKIQKAVIEQGAYVGSNGTIYIDLYSNTRDKIFFIKEGETRTFNILTNNKETTFVKWKNYDKDIIKLSDKESIIVDIKGKKEGLACPYAMISIVDSDISYGLYFYIQVRSKDSEETDVMADMKKSANDEKQIDGDELIEGLITYNELLYDDDYEIINDSVSPEGYPIKDMCAEAIQYTVLTNCISANMNYKAIRDDLVGYVNEYGLYVYGLSTRMKDYILDIIEDNEKRAKDNREYQYVTDIVSAKIFRYYIEKGPQKGCTAPGIILTYKLNNDSEEHETDTFFFFEAGIKPGLSSGIYNLGGTSGFLDYTY